MFILLPLRLLANLLKTPQNTINTGGIYKSDYSYVKTNPLMRYATAGFGGALGGGIFKTADRLVYNKSAYKN